jgi:hypothetical protein
VAAIAVAANAAAMGGVHRATAVGFVSAFSRLPVHPVNMKANNRTMIRIRAIPFCQVSEQGYAAKDHRNWRLAHEGGLCIGGHQIEKAAGIFALRPPGKN